MIGITSYGAYIPRLRLDRMTIFQSMGWFAPAIMMVAQGQRSMCYWDEDSLTMAVAAARDCLTGQDKLALDAAYFASTTFPFADRQNAGVLATALNLRDDIGSTDFTGAIKAGSSALATALDAVSGGGKKNILVAAADKRQTKPAYFYEMWYGDGAAALTVGDKDVVAEHLGTFSVSYDFVDHYRGQDHAFDYVWEERWARDEGYSKIIPEAINGLLKKCNLTMDQVAKVAYPCFFKAEHKNIGKILGATGDKLVSNMHEECGETGCAHSLVLLVAALEQAKPGDIVVMAGFGQGCDAMAFKVTENIAKLAPRKGFAGHIADQKMVDNYAKFLVWRDLLHPEMGIRAECPTQTAMSSLWRNRKMLLGMVGGKCRECGTPQFPRMDICVNPACGAHKSQDDCEFADQKAFIRSFTGDMLSVSVDPPNKYGMVQFNKGGRFFSDFTDCDQDELSVGLPMKMVFRRRVVDRDRGFTNYFWKATPDRDAIEEMKKIRFDGKVAIITGAGGGLGRVYALQLAALGAKVVVNDLGGSRDGSGGGSATPAQKVVDEIVAAGGSAVANYDNVATAEGGAGIVKSAVDAFGTVDIVINNAGILRDKSFLKMESDNWNAVVAVHLTGAYNVTKPAWEIMKDKGYGRVIMTTSAAGLYGNFGQTNYSSAKMALVGLMNTLKIEGAKYNIKVNTVAPLAASRLTEDIMPPDLFAKSKPEFVSPMVLYLCSDRCDQSGEIYCAGMGYFQRAQILTGPGAKLGEGGKAPSLEDIADAWDAINNMAGAKEIADATGALIALSEAKPPSAAPAPAAPAAGGGEAPPAAGGAPAVSVKDVFEMMPSVFNAGASAGVDVVFQYVISGTGGGEWAVAVKDGKCSVENKKADSPTTTLKMEVGDFLDLSLGKLNPMKAYTSGKLKIEGDIMKSQLLEKLFSPPK